MRLIDADALIGSLHQYGFCDGDDRTMVYKVIRLQPTIEPERKKGKWETAYLDHESIGVRPKVLYCSECKQCIAYPTNFCPNCGADMREGEQND